MKIQGLIYGGPHKGKTCMLGLLARQYQKKYPSKKIRLYTAETYDPLRKLIKEGLIEVLTFSNTEYPWEASKKMAEGCWVNDQGKLVPTTDWSGISACFYEGLNTFSTLLAGMAKKGGIAARTARGENIGSVKEKIRFFDGANEDAKEGEYFGTLGWNQFGIVQGRMLDIVQVTLSIPVDTWWTSQEAGGEDDTNNLVVGPLVLGKAVTGIMPKYFGPCIRLVTVRDPKSPKELEYRIQLKPVYVTYSFPETRMIDGKMTQSTVTKEIPTVATLRADLETSTLLPSELKSNNQGIEQLFSYFDKIFVE